MEEETYIKPSWDSLRNPFNLLDTSEVISGHVSGRRTDILQVITGGQSAFVLAGAPYIGKTTLIRYLQLPLDSKWSWRNELLDFPNQQKLENIHFVQVDLTPLENITSKEDLRTAFVRQCAIALQSVYDKGKHIYDEFNLKGLINLLRVISQETPHAHYFLMLDTIERLGRFGVQSFNAQSKAQTPQEQGLALLDHCNAIRTLVDLIDEFRILGFILSIESLPRAKVADQFTHVSADLARFKTMTLQTFTWQDAGEFLAQEPESFGAEWAKGFRDFSENCIFSENEQEWLREQSGTHPYLLQQACFYAFHLKQANARLHGTWTELQEGGKRQIIDGINEALSTFFTRMWKRLQEALKSDIETKEKTLADFREFIHLLSQKQALDEIYPAYWDQWGSELRYILCSEGILRYDPFQPIHFPGNILRHYLAQKARENGELLLSPPVSPPATGRGFWLDISHPQKLRGRISLSELEYHLLKTLLQNPKHCSELELMLGAWGKKIDKTTFTQRLYHLRKKLKEQCETEIIENRYGGLYSLNHPEWFQLN